MSKHTRALSPILAVSRSWRRRSDVWRVGSVPELGCTLFRHTAVEHHEALWTTQSICHARYIKHLNVMRQTVSYCIQPWKNLVLD